MSDQVGNPEDRFSHNEAHFSNDDKVLISEEYGARPEADVKTSMCNKRSWLLSVATACL